MTRRYAFGLLLSGGILTFAIGVAGAQQGASRPLGDEARDMGPVRVPCALPPWIDGDPLTAIGRQLEVGDGTSGRELLLRLLRERGSALILSPDTDATTQIDPPWFVLARWYAALPSPSKERLRLPTKFAEREFGSGAVDGASPLIWLEGLEDLALRRLEEAIESGDHDTATLLLRRPGLTERLHPRLRSWSMSSSPPLPAPAPTPPPSFRRLTRFRNQLEANPIDDLEERPRPDSRRVPLADLVPAVREDVAIIPASPSPLALELRPPYRTLAVLAPPYPGGETTCEPMRDIGWFAAFDGASLVLPLRTPKEEYAPTIDWIQDSSIWKDLGWNEARIFRWHTTIPESAPVAATRLAEGGFTIGGAPWVSDGVVVWLATRGFGEIETWLIAHRLADGRELWRTHLGTIARPWHSLRDLAALLPEGRIVAYRDELFVIHGGGWIARVGRSRGDLRGVILYPRILQSSETRTKWGRHYFKRLPALRPRYLGDAWVDEGGGSPRLIALPPDARQVMGIDLEKWQITWARPVTELTLLRRDHSGHPWLIDLNFEPGQRSFYVLSLEPETGRLREPGNLRLEIPGERSGRRSRSLQFTPTAADLAPLISGVPGLAGDSIAVPIREGWALWSCEPLVGGLPERVIPWPEDSLGGTLIPAGEGRWIVIHRADPEWGSPSTVEVWEGIEK